MIETLMALAALVGGLSLIFAGMAIVSDYVIPAVQRHSWRGRITP